MSDAAPTTDAPDPIDALKALEPPSPGRRLFTIFVAHFVAIVAALALWAAADTWQHVTHLKAAAFLSVATAMIAGALVTALIHEWGHYIGARFSGSTYEIPDRIGLFLYQFDYANNTAKQFDVMSWAGQIGGIVAVLLLWIAIPMDSAGRVMLVCAGIGYVVFTIAFEWPIIGRARASGKPLQELSTVTRAYIHRCEAIGAAAAVLVWLIAA